MNICVCGWYYKSGFLDFLRSVKDDYNIQIVSHKKLSPSAINDLCLPYIEKPNIGLEFGAYNHYLMSVWDKETDVLFCHDDTHVSDKSVLLEISSLDCDCSFIFKNEEDASQNKGHNRMPFHGRGIFVKRKLLRKFFEDGGIWYDENNNGYNKDPTPVGISDVNAAVRIFKNMVIEFNGRMRIEYFSQWNNGWRGMLDKKK